jgi:hypothetical protein
MKTRGLVIAAVCITFLSISMPILAIPGGWHDAKVDDAEVVAAAKFAVTTTQAKHEKLTLDRVVGAAQQVVAGMNYWVDLELTDRDSGKPVQRKAEAVIYRDLGGNYSLTSWKWKKR